MIGLGVTVGVVKNNAAAIISSQFLFNLADGSSQFLLASGSDFLKLANS